MTEKVRVVESLFIQTYYRLVNTSTNVTQPIAMLHAPDDNRGKLSTFEVAAAHTDINTRT
jgi:hypothetical protein